MKRSSLVLSVLAGLAVIVAASAEPRDQVRYVDQGPKWSAGLRDAYYTQDQGSRLIPLSWLQALR